MICKSCWKEAKESDWQCDFYDHYLEDRLIELGVSYFNNHCDLVVRIKKTICCNIPGKLVKTYLARFDINDKIIDEAIYFFDEIGRLHAIENYFVYEKYCYYFKGTEIIMDKPIEINQATSLEKLKNYYMLL